MSSTGPPAGTQQHPPPDGLSLIAHPRLHPPRELRDRQRWRKMKPSGLVRATRGRYPRRAFPPTSSRSPLASGCAGCSFTAKAGSPLTSRSLSNASDPDPASRSCLGTIVDHRAGTRQAPTLPSGQTRSLNDRHPDPQTADFAIRPSYSQPFLNSKVVLVPQRLDSTRRKGIPRQRAVVRRPDPRCQVYPSQRQVRPLALVSEYRLIGPFLVS